MNSARILGIDPGTLVTGYALLDQREGKLFPVALGVWKMDSRLALGSRLGQLLTEFLRLLEAYQPTTMCIEQVFLAKNPRSALYLGHARGVFMAAAHNHGLMVHEVSPTQAKKRVTGEGRAPKTHVAQCLSRLLNVSLDRIPLDASDALGIAYAHCLSDHQVAPATGTELWRGRARSPKQTRKAWELLCHRKGQA